MKCSLLTLSTFIDDALPSERAAEVDAHLVACPRCSAGVATLREERDRVGGLARVRVDWDSAQSMLEQVGIGATTGPAPARRQQPIAPAAPTRPWLSAGGGGAALPWTPRRPPVPATPTTAITEEADVQTVSPDVQPDLPFDAPHDPSMTASPEVEAVGHPSPGAAVTGWGTDLDDQPAAPLEDWEAAIPAYAEPDAWVPPAPVTPGPAGWAEPPAWTEPVTAVAATPAADTPVLDAYEPPDPVAAVPFTADAVEPLGPVEPPRPVGPPQRLERASGASALVGRARDFVSVRLALARSRPAEDSDLDTLPPVAPAPLSPVRPAMPIRGFEEPDRSAPLPVAPPSPVEAAPVAAPPAPAPFTPAAARAEAIRALHHREEHHPVAGVAEDWNAFGAAAYQRAPDVEPAARPQKMGRHLKKARRQPVPLRTRLAPVVAAVGGAAAAVATAAGAGARGLAGAARTVGARASSSIGSAATAGARTATTGARSAASGARTPTVSPRILVAGGAAVVVFLLALFVGRGGSTSPAPSASHGSTASTSATQGNPAASTSTSTQTAPSTATSGTPANAPLTGVKTYGAGATGVSLDRVRYGVFNGSQRLVFDMSGTASPTTTIGFSSPTTLVITFRGSSPPSAWEAPPTGGVVTAIATTSSGGGTTTVTLTLSRAATPVAFYLSAPERFVLDLH